MIELSHTISIHDKDGINHWIDHLEKYVEVGHKLVELALANKKELNSPDMQNLVTSVQTANIALFFAKQLRDNPHGVTPQQQPGVFSGGRGPGGGQIH